MTDLWIATAIIRFPISDSRLIPCVCLLYKWVHFYACKMVVGSHLWPCSLNSIFICVNKNEKRLHLWKWEHLVPRIKKAISEWSHMRGTVKITPGQCIKIIYKYIHQQKLPLHNAKLTHHFSFRNINLKLDHHRGGKWFILSPKHCKVNYLLSLKHSCWLGWV